MPQIGEQSLTHPRRLHFVLIALGLVAVVRLMVSVGEHGRVFVAGLTVPETCFAKIYFGADCPGCGLTRSMVHLAHGRFSDSVKANPGGAMLAVFACLLLARMWFPEASHKRLPSDRILISVVAAFVVTILVNWIVR